jgi:thiamine-monophosphate kinase
MGEFDLIERYFKRAPQLADVGVGDDCALWTPRYGHQLAFSADMLVEGRHFLSTVNPHHLGHKSLAVNLSDLAACGATPQAFLLSLSLPRADEVWLASFSKGLLDLADLHACELIGGDTTQGPLNIAITVMGDTPQGQSILRSGARVGDDLYVSGHLGDARLALEAFRGTVSLPQNVFDLARLCMECPTPRIALGQALRGIANAMADISDGLIGDLGHILNASHVGAEIDISVAARLMQTGHLWSCPEDLAMTCVLSGGDDYELVFSASPNAADQVLMASKDSATPVTRIGRITDSQRLVLLGVDGQPVNKPFHSFDHFA